MAVKCYALTDLGTLRLAGAQNVIWVVDTTAERPTSGMRDGDLVVDNQTDTVLKATSATALVAVGTTTERSVTQQATQSLTNGYVNTELLFPVLASKSYSFRAIVSITVTTNATCSFGLTFPSGLTATWGLYSGQIGGAQSFGNVFSQTGHPVAATVTATSLIVISGVVTAGGSAGNVTLQAQHDGSPGTDGTLLKGSSISWSLASA